jgi:hypothetical protein
LEVLAEIHDRFIANSSCAATLVVSNGRTRGGSIVNKKIWIICGGVLAAAIVIGGSAGGLAIATGGDDDEAPITGEALDRASHAALEHTGEGRVTETEVGDEESYYEVEVTLDDGSQVDVQLDENFNVVSDEADDENEDEASDQDD